MTGLRYSPLHVTELCRQEGEVNTSDLAHPMIMAIMTSRRTKRANAQKSPKMAPLPFADTTF